MFHPRPLFESEREREGGEFNERGLDGATLMALISFQLSAIGSYSSVIQFRRNWFSCARFSGTSRMIAAAMIHRGELMGAACAI
jgi:hypothetical protein